mmetsp:Transcript_20072/g.29028  ORF Transcript_20072/g.29028 Transcript_20072/m.29028 type:complete len:358 (+) Transcript_20072:82-1155(+)
MVPCGSQSCPTSMQTITITDSSSRHTSATKRIMPRRRRAEHSSLEIEAFVKQSDNSAVNSSYSTFDNNHTNLRSLPGKGSNAAGSVIEGPSDSNLGFDDQVTQANQRQNRFRIWIIATAALVLFMSLRHHGGRESEAFMEDPFAHWDHNQYNKDKAFPLLVQLSSPEDKQSSDISSKPNRAYARQWSIDFLLHFSKINQSHHQAEVLWDIFETQEKRRKEFDERKSASGEDSVEDGARTYSAIIFISKSAIITNIDYDPANMVPKNDVVSIGMTKLDGDAPVMIWNLMHPKFQDMAKEWLLYPNLSVLEKSDNLALVKRIPFDQRVIKYWDGESITSLQNTVDSVCYRYYPKCDVVQ